MEKTQIATYGIVGSLVLILGGYLGTTLTDSDIDKMYICASTQEVGVFDYLSFTGRLAYFFDDKNNRHTAYCTGGKWQKLRDYADQNNIDLTALTQIKQAPTFQGENIPFKEYTGSKVVCTAQGCKEIEQ